ncbi:hypothetical protein [Sphingobacterium sp. SGR-19]|uniref:hypothetical protein n=1 Tax=Sphingobacterium sp. SGR-19 TaxID=2710886 RepID=UPI0013EB31EF|nr:hypothetical protein [Sphingobacterium sp. SGR-19]NGM65429.1 hypothetical protein [Sphingobacterium sp. SGR-19]
MIRDRIWNELCDAKKCDLYLGGYLSYLRAKRKRFNMGKIVFAIAGIAVNNWLPNSSLVVLFTLTLFELLKDIIPELSVDEKLMDKLPEYRMLYVSKFDNLDRLFLMLNDESISKAGATEEYFKIREINIRIEDMDNSIHLPEKKKIFSKAESKFNIFINNMYNLEC